MNVISHQAWASRVKLERGWYGKLSAPGLGVLYVRDGDGAAIRFDTEEKAEAAAQRALLRKLDEGRRPRSAKAVEFRTMGQGRNRRAEAVRGSR